MTDSRRTPSFLALALLAGALLYFALRTSTGDFGTFDAVVAAVLVGVLVWNVARLDRRMARHRGPRGAWQVRRVALLWVVGLMNTVAAPRFDPADWRIWVGMVLVVLAVGDTAWLARRERSVLRELRGSAGGDEAEPEARRG